MQRIYALALGLPILIRDTLADVRLKACTHKSRLFVRVMPDVQAIFCRRRHHARRPPLAIRSGMLIACASRIAKALPGCLLRVATCARPIPVQQLS
jgi:hypothetical protein